MPNVAHFALEIAPTPTINPLELSSALMIAFIRIAELLLHFGDAPMTLRRKNIQWRFSINELSCTMNQILFDPEFAATVAWICPFDATPIAELSTTTAASRLSVTWH